MLAFLAILAIQLPLTYQSLPLDASTPTLLSVSPKSTPGTVELSWALPPSSSTSSLAPFPLGYYLSMRLMSSLSETWTDIPTLVSGLPYATAVSGEREVQAVYLRPTSPANPPGSGFFRLGLGSNPLEFGTPEVTLEGVIQTSRLFDTSPPQDLEAALNALVAVKTSPSLGAITVSQRPTQVDGTKVWLVTFSSPQVPDWGTSTPGRGAPLLRVVESNFASGARVEVERVQEGAVTASPSSVCRAVVGGGIGASTDTSTCTHPVVGLTPNEAYEFRVAGVWPESDTLRLSGALTTSTTTTTTTTTTGGVIVGPWSSVLGIRVPVGTGGSASAPVGAQLPPTLIANGVASVTLSVEVPYLPPPPPPPSYNPGTSALILSQAMLWAPEHARVKVQVQVSTGGGASSSGWRTVAVDMAVPVSWGVSPPAPVPITTTRTGQPAVSTATPTNASTTIITRVVLSGLDPGTLLSIRARGLSWHPVEYIAAVGGSGTQATPSPTNTLGVDAIMDSVSLPAWSPPLEGVWTLPDLPPPPTPFINTSAATTSKSITVVWNYPLSLPTPPTFPYLPSPTPFHQPMAFTLEAMLLGSATSSSGGYDAHGGGGWGGGATNPPTNVGVWIPVGVGGYNTTLHAFTYAQQVLQSCIPSSGAGVATAGAASFKLDSARLLSAAQALGEFGRSSPSSLPYTTLAAVATPTSIPSNATSLYQCTYSVRVKSLLPLGLYTFRVRALSSFYTLTNDAAGGQTYPYDTTTSGGASGGMMRWGGFSGPSPRVRTRALFPKGVLGPAANRTGGGAENAAALPPPFPLYLAHDCAVLVWKVGSGGKVWGLPQGPNAPLVWGIEMRSTSGKGGAGSSSAWKSVWSGTGGVVVNSDPSTYPPPVVSRGILRMGGSFGLLPSLSTPFFLSSGGGTLFNATNTITGTSFTGSNTPGDLFAMAYLPTLPTFTMATGVSMEVRVRDVNEGGRVSPGVVITPPSPPPPLQWSRVLSPPISPPPLSGATLVPFGGGKGGLLWGGLAPSGGSFGGKVSSDLWRLDVVNSATTTSSTTAITTSSDSGSSPQWTKVVPGPHTLVGAGTPPPREGHSSVSLGGRMYMLGGRGHPDVTRDGGPYFSDMWVLEGGEHWGAKRTTLHRGGVISGSGRDVSCGVMNASSPPPVGGQPYTSCGIPEAPVEVGVLSLPLLISSDSEGATTTTTTTTTTTIPDDACVEKVQVWFEIAHPCLSELRISLVGPASRTTALNASSSGLIGLGAREVLIWGGGGRSGGGVPTGSANPSHTCTQAAPGSLPLTAYHFQPPAGVYAPKTTSPTILGSVGGGGDWDTGLSDSGVWELRGEEAGGGRLAVFGDSFSASSSFPPSSDGGGSGGGGGGVCCSENPIIPMGLYTNASLSLPTGFSPWGTLRSALTPTQRQILTATGASEVGWDNRGESGGVSGLVTRFTGHFPPASSLSAFIGSGANGVWTLKVWDAVGNNNTGVLLRWGLVLKSTQCTRRYQWTQLFPPQQPAQNTSNYASKAILSLPVLGSIPPPNVRASSVVVGGLWYLWGGARAVSAGGAPSLSMGDSFLWRYSPGLNSWDVVGQVSTTSYLFSPHALVPGVVMSPWGVLSPPFNSLGGGEGVSSPPLGMGMGVGGGGDIFHPSQTVAPLLLRKSWANKAWSALFNSQPTSTPPVNHSLYSVLRPPPLTAPATLLLGTPGSASQRTLGLIHPEFWVWGGAGRSTDAPSNDLWKCVIRMGSGGSSNTASVKTSLQLESEQWEGLLLSQAEGAMSDASDPWGNTSPLVYSWGDSSSGIDTGGESDGGEWRRVCTPLLDALQGGPGRWMGGPCVTGGGIPGNNTAALIAAAATGSSLACTVQHVLVRAWCERAWGQSIGYL